jgi:hypothetical protein
VEGIKVGNLETDLVLYNKLFFTTKLLLDENVWGLNNINIQNEIYPVLIGVLLS